MSKRIEKENLTFTEILNYTRELSNAVDQITDQDTWLVLSLTLRSLEPIRDMIEKMIKALQEKHYMKDANGNYILRKVSVVDDAGNVLLEKVTIDGKEVERPMYQEVKQIASMSEFEAATEKLMQQTKPFAWEETIPYKKMVQFPAGLRTLQHKLLDRVILLDH